LYEEKYGILSADFYKALMSGALSHYDDFDEHGRTSAAGRGPTKRGSGARKPKVKTSKSETSPERYGINLSINTVV
jgi:hypothetical protein